MKILYGVTGGVAAILAFKIVERLKKSSHEVEMILTDSSRYFLSGKDDKWIEDSLGVKVWDDRDEWPAGFYIKDEPVRHIELRDWADVLLLAPLTANTLAKMANGMADNLLTCVARAWNIEKKPIVIAPSMNTQMWLHPATQEHLNKLGAWYKKFTIVPPVSKKLACGDTGIGALADIEDIVKAIDNW